MELRQAIGRIATAFDIPGAVIDVQSYGSGHIHATYKISCQAESFLLQKVNTFVFPDPDLIISNLLKVNEHLASKDYQLALLELIPTKSGTYLHQTSKDCWRMYRFIDNSYSVNRVEHPEQAQLVGKSFGYFLAQLNDLSVEGIKSPLPDFHNISDRLLQFEDAQINGISSRIQKARELIENLKGQQILVTDFQWTHFPQRITHNDTKINNLLLDQSTGNCKAIIDLDTLMPGSWLYDFGDMVRTSCCNEEEACTDFDQVYIRKDLYHAAKAGFLESLGSLMTKEEQSKLDRAAQVVIYIQSVRFLTDYLMGDIYYKVNYDQQNFDRAFNQWHLLARANYHSPKKM